MRLDFRHDPGPIDGDYFMPQSIGSGGALFDFDADGRLDLYLLQNGGPESGSTNRLYRQTEQGTFEDVSAGSGLDVAGYGMGVAAGDVNNDGLLDLCITEFARVRLFLNQGSGRFAEVSESVGIVDRAWAVSAGFLDYDRDGWLDLVVANYIDYAPHWECSSASGAPDYCAPYAFQGMASRLFHNLGRQSAPADSVRFEETTVSSGIASRMAPGLGVLCADINGDHWPDILIANDDAANHLWINQHDGTFVEQGLVSGLATNSAGQFEGNMGIGWGDVNGDLLSDVFITHLTREHHTLWIQHHPGQFEDRTAASGLAKSHWRSTGFGTVLQDFDLDGALDIAIASGRVSRDLHASADERLGPHWSAYAERNQLFQGDGRGEFHDVSERMPAFCGTRNVARGLMWGDIDNDGDIDLVLTAIGGPARIFRNIAPRTGHWLLVRAIDPALRRDAYGASVTIRAGRRQWIGTVTPGGSFACSNDPRVHFGIGDVTQYDRLRVVWPDGNTEEFAGGPTDHLVVIEKGTGDAEKHE
jgi:hypothetical protein